MTYLQLLQKAMEHSGETDYGAAPQVVTGLKGIQGRFALWVALAWQQIQEERQDYTFMRTAATHNLSPDKSDYSLVEMGIDDLDRWEFTGASYYPVGKPGERRPLFSEIEYADILTGSNLGFPGEGPPVSVMTKDGTFNDLYFFPTPDQAYTVEIPYYIAPVMLSKATDKPALWPENLQWIIIWRTLWLYAYYDGAPDIAEQASAEYTRLSSIIDSRYKPQMSIDHYAHSIGVHR